MGLDMRTGILFVYPIGATSTHTLSPLCSGTAEGGAYAIYLARHCCPHTSNNLVVVQEVLRGVAYRRSNIVAMEFLVSSDI